MLRTSHMIVLGIGIALAPVRAAHAVEPTELLEQLIARREALEKREIAYTATGSWERQYPNGEDDAKVETLTVLAYGTGEFNLAMSSTTPFPRKSSVLKRIVVSDGTAIVATEFGPNFHPSGCATEVRDNTLSDMVIATGGLTINPVTVHYASSPSRQHAELVEKVSVRETKAGTLELVLRFPKKERAVSSEVVFEIDPKLGNNVVSATSQIDGYYGPASRRTLDWLEVDGEWLVTRFVCEQYNRDGSLYDRSDLRFSSIERVKSHDSSRFTVEGSNECGSTRIIDRRADKSAPFLKTPIPEWTIE